MYQTQKTLPFKTPHFDGITKICIKCVINSWFYFVLIFFYKYWGLYIMIYSLKYLWFFLLGFCIEIYILCDLVGEMINLGLGVLFLTWTKALTLLCFEILSVLTSLCWFDFCFFQSTWNSQWTFCNCRSQKNTKDWIFEDIQIEEELKT